MPLSSIFARLAIRMPLRRLAALALALAGLLGSSLAQAAVVAFNGQPVGDCTLADKVYSCASTAWLGGKDEVFIAGGYTLKLASHLTLAGNQGLAMAAGAKLVVTGNLDIRSVKSAGLSVDGGSIEVGGTFSMGEQKQTLSADVSAQAVHLGSSARVNGNVDAGSLVLEPSAQVRGSAWVDAARLEWHSRVAGTIHCKQGTATNQCDCVTNNSGYSVNSANGPRCESAQPAGVHHYLITHDGQANSCTDEAVTVTACANAACAAPHVAAAPDLTLNPGGITLSFGSSGIAQASVTAIQAGKLTLGLATTAPVACLDSASGSDSCAMAVSGETAFEIVAPDHRAGEVRAATLQALKPSANRQACVPAFKDTTLNLSFSCEHASPSSGRDYLHLDEKGKLSETSSAPLACSGMAAGTVPTTRQVAVSFDAGGIGSVGIRYPDVGSVRLKASYAAGGGAAVEGEGLFTVAPYRFGLVATTPAAGFVAGAPFELRVSSLNKAGAITRGFDAGLLPAAPGIILGSCAAPPLRAGSVSPASAAAFRDGVATVQASWSEVGSMGLNASLADFLGTGIGSTGSSGDCSSLGPFVPAWLQVDRDPTVPARSFDYSGEPIRIVVSARNQQGEITRNYEQATGRSEDVALAAVLGAGGPGAWASTPTTIAAAAFTEGQAAWSRAYVVGKDARPAALAIRATSASAGSKDKGENLKTEVRLGRLRLGSRFGGHKATLSIPVTAEYWTGKSWLLNSEDSHTLIPQAAFAFKPAAGLTPAPAFAAGPLKLAGGAAAFGLRVSAGGPGPVDIALNLGSGTQDDACIAGSAGSGVASTGAGIPWLRPFTTGCAPSQARDPYGRATFGVYTPENRRIIHVREVFN